MTVSFPSRPVLSIDVPEVKNFGCEFVYNFFVADERTNERGEVEERFANRSGHDLLEVTPRYIKLSWSKIELRHLARQHKNELVKQKDFIKKNLDKVYKEEQMSGYGFTGIEFQDTGIDGKLHLIASGTVAKMVNSDNIRLANQVNRAVETLADKIDMNKVSLLDVAKYLVGEMKSDVIHDKIVIDALTDLGVANVKFMDDDQTRQRTEDTFKRLKSVKTRYKINNKFIKHALSTIARDPVGFFADEIGPLLTTAGTVQQQALAGTNPDVMEETEFDVVVDPIRIRSVAKDTVFMPTISHVGYIIEKFERSANGTLRPKESIIIESADTVGTVDNKILYGVHYVYQIRAVYALEFMSFAEDDEEMAIVTILVASAPSSRSIVECVDHVPPPVPSDINVYWDGREGAPVVEWAFPPNPQQDIKKWQVFRRSSIHEPFELQAQFDFDDSVVPTTSFETVDANLVKKLRSPQNFYVDHDFDRQKTYIYTVCAVDAHGLSSNYGMQFEVRYDNFKNNVVKRLISSSGAPKSYPNLYLNADTFVDVIKDSNHTSVRIYFDPEYLSVIRQGSQEELFIGTKQNDTSYKVQFINVDFQQSQMLDIMIDDLRKKKAGRLSSGKKAAIAPGKVYFSRKV